MNNSRKIKGRIERIAVKLSVRKRVKKGRGVDLSSPIAKKSAIPAAADSNYIFGHRCEISQRFERRKGGRGRRRGGRSPIPIVLITWRALGPARSFLLFLLIRFWHQLSSRELCYLCDYHHVKIHFCRYLFNVARFGAPMSINISPGYLLIFNLRFLQSFIYIYTNNFDGC